MQRDLKRLLTVVGIALSGLFMWLALRDVELSALWGSLRRANLLWLVPFLLSLAVFCWLKAARWALLLAPIGKIDARGLVSPVVIGYMGTGLLPMQLGEVLRAYLAAGKMGTRMGAVLASLIVERILDVFMLLLIVGIVGLLGTDLAGQYRAVGLAFAIAALLACAALWIFATHSEWFIAFAQRTTAFVPAGMRERLLEQLRAAAAGADILRQTHQYAMLALLSLLQWICMWACTWISLAAVGLYVSPTAALAVLATTMVSMTLPSGPGYVGTLQLAYVLALAPFGVGRDVALAASFVYLAALWVPLIFGGLLLLHRTGTRLSTLTQQVRREAA